MTQHSEYSPSRLARILACPGSVQACAGETSTSSKYADEGTLLHLAISRAIDGVPISQTMLKPVALSIEQVSAIDECYAYLSDLTQFKSSHIKSEVKTTLEAFDFPDVYGTCDVVVHQPDDKTLHIIDWKFGKGVPVYAEANDQLIAYAIGAIEAPSLLSQYDEIWIHIAQPRLNSFTRWQLTEDYIYSWLDRLGYAVLLSQAKEPPFCPGEKQCRWCDAKLFCKARRAAANELAAQVFKVHADLPAKVDMLELSELLAKVPQLESYLDDLQQFAINTITSGQDFPGFKMVEGRSTRHWKNERAAIDALAAHNIEDIFESKFVSPAKAEKLLTAADKKSEWFRDLIWKPEGAPTLVPAIDKREALKFSSPFEKFIEN
jgi:hypothetical protein